MLASTATGLARRQFGFSIEVRRSGQGPHREETEKDLGSGMGGAPEQPLTCCGVWKREVSELLLGGAWGPFGDSKLPLNEPLLDHFSRFVVECKTLHTYFDGKRAVGKAASLNWKLGMIVVRSQLCPPCVCSRQQESLIPSFGIQMNH